MNDDRNNLRTPKGLPLAIDPSAKSGSQDRPAFLSRPEGAPVYYGFQVLRDVSVSGFSFGKITDFEAEPSLWGDAFVIAPDDSRAGLVWEVSNNPRFEQILPMEPTRWGVWGVAFPYEMTSRENVTRNLEAILPDLKRKWQEWCERFAKS